jgi:hypothetical protein
MSFISIEYGIEMIDPDFTRIGYGCSSLTQLGGTTVYRYRCPVALGDHRLMLRPRDSHDLRLIQTNLNLSPPATLRWSHDVFGN